MNKDLDQKRDEMAKDLAKQVIKIVCEHVDQLDPTEQDGNKLAEMYKPIFNKFLELSMTNNVPISYMPYIFGLVQVMFNKSAHYLQLWVNTNQELVDAIVHGRESSYEVTVTDLAKYLDEHKDAWMKIIQDSKAAMAKEKEDSAPTAEA